MVEKAQAEQSQRARRWAPFTFAAATTLVVAVLVLPWTPWPGDEFGDAPWWVWGPLVVSVVLLLVGVGERKYTVSATATAAVAMVAGVVSFLTWPREEVVLDGRTHERIRERPWLGDVPPEWWLRLYPAEPPAAPLACALAAAVLLALGVVTLVRRQDPWTGSDVESGPGSRPGDDDRPPPTGPTRRQARRAMAAGLVGMLVGGVLGAGSAYGAGGLQRERMEALGPWWGPLAESVPVPEDRLHEGAFEWDQDREDDFVRRLPERPTRVAWQHDFAGPVALSTCGRDGRARATLVALEESEERSLIVGHDARDGTLRWSLTVHRRDTAELTQVAVGEGCSVLVLIGTVLLAVDPYSGKVTGSSVLPRAELAAWHFRTQARDVSPWPRLVGLREAEYAHLTASTDRIVTVRRSDAEPVAWAPRRFLCSSVDYSSYWNGSWPTSGQLLMDGCGDRPAVAVLPEPNSPEELRTERPPAYRLPPLEPLLAYAETPVPAPPPGCRRSEPVRIRSASAATILVETEMDCAGKKHRARISLRGHDLVEPQDWEISPEADAAPDFTFVRSNWDLLEVWGDTVKMLSGDRFHARWTVVPQRGDPVVGLADSRVGRQLDGWQGPISAGIYTPILALTRSGTLIALADFDPTEETRSRVQIIASSDVARQPCAGERGLLADKASGTALVLCTTNGRTHVTAVSE